MRAFIKKPKFTSLSSRDREVGVNLEEELGAGVLTPDSQKITNTDAFEKKNGECLKRREKC